MVKLQQLLRWGVGGSVLIFVEKVPAVTENNIQQTEDIIIMS